MKLTVLTNARAVIALCELVHKLIADIQFLEFEFISTRYNLSQHMNKEEGELLRMDILSYLTGRYEGNPANELFKIIMYNGGDARIFRDYFVKVQEACKGNWPCLY